VYMRGNLTMYDFLLLWLCTLLFLALAFCCFFASDLRCYFTSRPTRSAGGLDMGEVCICGMDGNLAPIIPKEWRAGGAEEGKGVADTKRSYFLVTLFLFVHAGVRSLRSSFAQEFVRSGVNARCSDYRDVHTGRLLAGKGKVNIEIMVIPRVLAPGASWIVAWIVTC